MTSDSRGQDRHPPEIYGRLVRGYALGVGIYYAAVTPLNFSLIPSAIYPMLACTTLSAGVSLGAWLACRGAKVAMGRLEAAAVVMNAVLLCNVMLHTFLVRDAHLLIYFAPIALIFGVIGPSLRVVFPSLAATGVCAVVAGYFMPQTYRNEFNFALATIMFVAVGATLLLHGAIRQKSQALAKAEAAATALDRALRRANALAAEAEAAHAAKARFIANMSHEIRNPLNGMLGLTAALGRTALSPAQAETLALLDSSGHMLERIVSDVLDMEKLEAGKVDLEWMPIRLVDEIAGVVRLMSAQAEAKGLALTFEDCSPDAAPVAADPTRIKQIVVNLVSNALKFTPAGGVRVRLRVSAPEDEGLVPVAIEVIDTGIGFDSENASWLFDRFGQADASTTRKFGGTGLGLAICRGLARQMGGDVTATSALGAGSCFTVVLRLAAAEAAPSTSPPQEALPLAGRARVLVAEDNPANQRVIQLLLEAAEVEVVLVDNGEAAVEARRQADFDVILMDRRMPVLDGLAATRGIRDFERGAGLPAVPIVMLTGDASEEDRAQARAAGADDYVTKPISPASLHGALEGALARRAEAA